MTIESKFVTVPGTTQMYVFAAELLGCLTTPLDAL
jgi:hypothetical protein